MKTITIAVAVVALACLITFPIATAAKQSNRWPKPAEIVASLMDNNQHLRHHNISTQWWKCKSDPSVAVVTCPSPPPPPSSMLSSSLSSSLASTMASPLIAPPLKASDMQRCMVDSSTGTECYSQILTSFMGRHFHVDPQCCRVILNMGKRCNDIVFAMFKSPFFAPLVHYSCYLKQ